MAEPGGNKEEEQDVRNKTFQWTRADVENNKQSKLIVNKLITLEKV